MMTQRIRIVKNTNYSSISIGTVVNLFAKMQLNSLSTVPIWVTFDTSPGYIQAMDIIAATLPFYNNTVGEYYIYLTEGGSPPTEDALLIIEVVDELTDDVDSCVGMTSYLISSVSNSSGKLQVNLSANWDVYPKLDEYLYISGSTYSGYHRVYNRLSNTTIVLDVDYTTTITADTYYIYAFNRNTSKCLVWINREGGRSSMIFDQRKDYGLTAGDTKTFDNNSTVKYINRGKNFDNVTVYKTGLTNDEVDLVESLRSSIQVWEYDINTDVSTPIVIDSSSFNKYNTKNPFNEVSFKYRLGTYKTIQNQ